MNQDRDKRRFAQFFILNSKGLFAQIKSESITSWKLACLIVFFNSLAGCKMENDKITNQFSGYVTILLVDSLQGESKTIKIQDYDFGQGIMIPVFDSPEKAKQTSEKYSLKHPIIEIKGTFFIGLLKGNEVIRVNPYYPDQYDVKANELSEILKRILNKK